MGMSRAPLRFTEADLRRAVKAAGSASLPMAAEILPDGTIRMVPIEVHQEPKSIEPAPSYVYFVQAMESRRIKIGFSAKPQYRLLDISTYCPEPVKMLGTMPGTSQDERTIHKKFAAHRVIGEWFRDAPEILEFIAIAVVVPERA